jgi:hypothetical protein
MPTAAARRLPLPSPAPPLALPQPDWLQTTLTATGPAHAIAAFRAHLIFSFRTFFTLPDSHRFRITSVRNENGGTGSGGAASLGVLPGFCRPQAPQTTLGAGGLTAGRPISYP